MTNCAPLDEFSPAAMSWAQAAPVEMTSAAARMIIIFIAGLP
jgi:hypothetical protein